MLIILIIVAALWLAYSNGANDNFKGVATLYGSDTLSYKQALWLATLTTFTGGIVAIVAAKQLITTFSGKGLIPDAIASTPEFAVAVGLGAALTIFIATYIGMPTSTTHALIGGLLGSGLASRTSIDGEILVSKFAVPMLTSPIMAIGIAGLLYIGLTQLRRQLGIRKETCICLENGTLQPVGLSYAASSATPDSSGDNFAAPLMGGVNIRVDETAHCVERYQGNLVGIKSQSLLNGLHCVSAGAVCFSRAVNDTPKMAALLLSTAVLPQSWGVALIGLVMTIGGVIQSRRIAETMSKHITPLNPGQGFTANLTTAGLVLFASRLGVPVSTTHVSCGSIFGIGAANRSLDWQTIGGILTTWVTTLPLAAIVSGGLYWILS